MAKKKAKKQEKKKQVYQSNLYLRTTILAIIGTIIYSLIVNYAYSGYLTVTTVIVFFVVFWIVYYFIEKRMYKKYKKY